jgi:hypothetical protein
MKIALQPTVWMSAVPGDADEDGIAPVYGAAPSQTVWFVIINSDCAY